MDELFKPEEKKSINKVFVAALLVGVAVIGAVIFALSLKPSMEEQLATILEGSLREGSPEFAELTKDIIISTDKNTIESPMVTGTISMFINGKIRNKGTRTLNALEINCGVVTQFNQVLKEKRILVVPTQMERLEPNQTIPVTLSLDGFAKDDDRANIRWKVTAIRVEK
ncbi:MAG: hypothetical protein ACKVRN_15320 [Pyrinomonadaceae bacterium]